MAGLANIVGRAVVAGVAGSVVMTVFQKLIEMPLTGRKESNAPAKLAEKILPVKPQNEEQERRLNYITHFTLGATWGIAYGLAAYKGLRGRRAITWVFPAIYVQDVTTITALGLDKPWKWTRKEAAIDIVDKLVQVVATSFIFDRFLDPKRR
ncbi:MAG TPA: hypothetical protein VK978_01660 [Candidatus Saccharimonadales bacterium]|nr:hypothetical protein [Candidatus Saccharimonadales bacterium]